MDNPLKDRYYGPSSIARIKAGPGRDELTVEELDGTEISGKFKDFRDKWNFESSITERVKNKYEYITRLNLTEKDLNEYGKLGWELVNVQSITENKDGRWERANKFWFKRKNNI